MKPRARKVQQRPVKSCTGPSGSLLLYSFLQRKKTTKQLGRVGKKRSKQNIQFKATRRPSTDFYQLCVCGVGGVGVVEEGAGKAA